MMWCLRKTCVRLLPGLVLGAIGCLAFWSLSLSFFISVVVGITFGSYPAMRAAEQDPIVALRCD